MAASVHLFLEWMALQATFSIAAPLLVLRAEAGRRYLVLPVAAL